MMKQNMYDCLAAWYASLNGEVDYAGMADYVKTCFDRYFPEGVSAVLDLGCGSGNMTFPLSSRGYEMIGVDISSEMLAAARERAGAENVLWLCQDMRSFELYGTVEGVVCCLDGINHLTKPADVKRCLRLVHNYLVPNGIFVFDVNSPYKFETVYGKQSYVLEEEGVFCTWQNEYRPSLGVCDFYITLFEEQGDGSYLREDACDRERVYTLRSLKGMLKECGFELIAVTDDYTDRAVCDTTERYTLIARAKK